ncbi:MAG: NADP-dependent oxidoreductase [Gordonia sp. (in: high G+C Gram-positive bacteria)]|uniref:NADP-dependent oxidoreductase n=1 Tax=Gordonia sp. (in: high G+C Gram-positive bacteria) TaxID=84139 RepID=UPI0039E4C3BF
MADESLRTATAMVATEYGDPTTVVAARTVDIAPPGPGQVVVAVRAAGVNPVDGKVVRGLFGADPAALPRRIGSEAAGVVTAVGDGARYFDPDDDQRRDICVGDEVIVYRAVGGYAQALLADDTSVHPKPAALDFPVAAGLLLAGATAADMVGAADIRAGDTVVVHGGAGAVGTVAVQLARKAGATVIATAAPRNHDFLRALGAIPVAYGEGVADRIRGAAPGGVTAALDTVGTDEAIDTSLALGVPPTRIVSIAAFGRADDGIVIVDGSGGDSKRRREEAIAGLIAEATSGGLVVEVAKTFPLAQAGAALDELARAHPRGKFVLLP